VALVDTDAVGRAAESLDRWQWWRVHPSAGAGVLTR
jgi:hypothetical protein